MSPTATKRWSDPAMLIAPMRARVQELVALLERSGHEPLVWETYRSPERAAMLSSKGTGIARSMHCYGVAADIICKRHRWECHKHGCGFFEDLGKQAEELGLVWGGRWKRRDMPHVQGIPVGKQNAVRRAETNEERESLVREFLGVVV